MRSEKNKIDRIANHATESEKALEQKLAAKVKAWGGLCLKYHNATMAGYPDRIVLLPGGLSFWVEVKSKGQKPRKLQALRMGLMRRIGHFTTYVDSPEAIDGLLDEFNQWRKDNGL